MIYFVMFATTLFGFFALIWRNAEWYNTLLKLAFIGLTVWGVILTIQFYS